MTESDGGAPASGQPAWQPIRLEASATGGGDVYQSGRDLTVIRKPDGPRRDRPGREAREMLCPYPGLMPFAAEYKDWFYGRDQMIHTVIEQMDTRIREGGPLALIGPSGAGKSSLLAAGVLPALTAGRLPVAGSSNWPHLLLTPTASPALALAVAAGLDAEEALLTAALWRSDASRCVVNLRKSVGGGPVSELADGDEPAGLVVVVDQFEEVFTACADEAERAWFIDVLDRLARTGSDAAVLLSLRADFYAACTAYPQLRTALQAGPVVLGPMTEGELKEAIRLPAEDVALDVEDGLVEVLLSDLGAVGGLAGAGSAGRLPLLAHALRATWQQRSGHRLTVDGYRVTGGIQRALANTADRLYDGLGQDGRDAARWVFLRLVIVGQDADDTRRRVRYDELLRHAPDPESAEAVVDSFTRGRLLTRDQDAVTITHEVMIRAWPRLREWIERDRDGNLVRQELEAAAAAWEQADREPGALYRGTRLAIALAWAEQHRTDLSGAAGSFLAAARRLQRRGQRLRRSAVAATTVLAVAASTAAVFAFIQNANAARDRDKAINAAVASASLQQAPVNPSVSAQLALVAYRREPTEQAKARLITAENTPLDIRLPGSKGSVYTVAYSPDGHTLAAAYVFQNAVRLWDVSDPSRPAALGAPLPEDSSISSVLALAFSPDGHTLAVGGRAGGTETGGFVDLWNLTSPSHPVLLSRPAISGPNPFHFGSSVESLAFTSDGHTLAAAWSDDAVTLWNVSQPSDAIPDGPPQITCFPASSLAFTSDGHTLAVGYADDKGTVELWNTTNPKHPVRRGQPVTAGKAVNAVAFNPAGNTLAAGSEDQDVHLWNTTDPDHPAELVSKPLRGAAQSVSSVAFSPDGRILASGSVDHSVYLWNVADPGDISPLGRPLTGPGDGILGVAFSPDSRTLAAGNTDGDVDLWNLPPTQLIGGGGPLNGVAFSPDGRTLAAANANHTVSVWNTADPHHPAPRGQPLTGPTDPVQSVAFSPDGKTLAAGGDDGDVTLWNTTDPNHPVPLGPPFSMDHGPVYSLAFSPNGHTLAAAVDKQFTGGISVWDVTNPAQPMELGSIGADPSHSIFSVAFSTDGHTLIAGGDSTNHEVGLWTVPGADIPVRVGEPIPEPLGTTSWVALSPDGRTLAVGNSHGVITLWNSTDLNHLTPRVAPLTVPGGNVYSVAFSPDGKTLAAAGHASVGTIDLWNVADPDHPKPIGDPLTVTTGAVSVLTFSPDGHTLAAATDDGVATVWDLNVQAAVDDICANSAGALSRANWRTYVPVAAYAAPCPGA